jgi:MFS family permease
VRRRPRAWGEERLRLAPAAPADAWAPVVTAQLPAHPPSMFEALRFRDFRYLWVANLAANFAMQMQMMARGWIVYDMTQSAMWLSWVMLSFMLPQFLFSLVGGVVADRATKKTVMVVAQSLNAAATLAMALIIYTGNVAVWHFIAFGVFNGTVLSFSMPARSAVIPEIVGHGSLANAMALQSMVFNLSRIFGPIFAGQIIALFAADHLTGDAKWFGVSVIYFVICGLYLTSVVSTAAVHFRGAPSHSGKTAPLQDALEGLRYVRDEKLILGLLILGFVPMMFGFTASSLMPAFNHDVVLGGPRELSYLMTAMGAGALCASLLLARLGDIGRKGRTMLLTAVAWAVALGLFAVSSWLPAALFFCALIGLCSSMFGNLSGTTIQLSISQDVRGRVMSIMMMTHGLMPLGIIPISSLAEFTGIGPALVVSAVLLLASVLWLNWQFPDLRRIDKGHGEARFVGDAAAAAAAAADDRPRGT